VFGLRILSSSLPRRIEAKGVAQSDKVIFFFGGRLVEASGTNAIFAEKNVLL
jgi:hypothetical protein